MNRKVILIDLDQCVYPFVQQMARWLDHNGVLESKFDSLTTQYNGILPLHKNAMRHYKTWAVWHDWSMTRGEFDRWWRLGREDGFIYGSGQPLAGSREALWRLSDAEWDISIATARLNKFALHDKVVENTVGWLRRNNIPYRQLLFVNDKTKILADAIVDDKGENMSFRSHDRTFLFPANHNQGRNVTDIERVAAWKNITDTLLDEGEGENAKDN